MTYRDKFTRSQNILLISSFLMFPFTLVLFQVTNKLLEIKMGYVAGFIVYWGVALMITWILSRKNPGYWGNILKIGESSVSGILFTVIAILPVAGVFVISFLPNAAKLTVQTGLLVLFMAVMNGTIEEVYWRGLFLKEFKNNAGIGIFLSTTLFALWHVSLWFINGVTYDGFFALVGGAFILGFIWTVVSRKTGSIGICIIAHVLVNLFAFTGHHIHNGF